MSEATKDDPRGRHAHGHAPPPGGMAALALAALGVVFGDIGTSPLYAMKECFTGHHAVRPDEQGVLGVLSLMFWSLTSVVAVKYIAFIMRADNDGEGGILALLALVPEPSRKREGAGTPLVLLVLFGAALLYGDGVITPAISVLSAVEGLEVATVALKPVVVPTTVVILIALFLVQRRGTAGIGAVFGPVMIAWFVALAGLGVVQIAKNPAVFAALNPAYAVGYLVHHGYHGFLVLGSVVLCVTGGEALYADMGHFGARSIRLAWFFIVMPSLVLNYFGQGALVLADPKAAEQPFFAMVPRWGLYPMVALATAATVIASQALISGAFSLTRQAVQLGFCPRVTIVHTSKDQEGQIYIPEINTALMVSCIVLVLAFKESSKLAAAYGIAVTGTMAITSIVYYVVVTRTWGWAWWKAAPLVLGFLVFDGGFLAANIVKIADGGWVPLAMGLCVFTAMTTWKAGRKRLAQQIATASTSLDEFLGRVDAAPPPRVPGTAVFMTASPTGVSPVLLHHYRHNQVLHEQVVLLTILSEDVPFVSPKKRIRVEPLDHGFYRIKSSFGFMETPRIPAILEACAIFGLTIDPETVTFYVGRETLIASSRPGMARWRKGLFSFLSRNARTATAYFGIPPDRVVELGMQVELLRMPIEELWSQADEARRRRLVDIAGQAGQGAGIAPGELASALFAIEGASPEREARARLELSERAERVRAGSPAASPREQSELLASALSGYRGREEAYYDVESSHLSRVVESGHGMPILLSVVWILVGREAGVPVAGVGLPGHFIVRVGDGEGDLRDPFGGGGALSLADCRALVGRLSGGRVPFREEMLAPASPSDIVVRVLKNLLGSCQRLDDAVSAYRVARLWTAVEPDVPAPLLAQARFAESAGARHEAGVIYQALLSRFGGSPEAREAESGRDRLVRLGPLS